LRSGTFQRDAESDFAATGIYDGAPDGEPPYTRCPDCKAIVNPEHADVGDDQRQNAIQLHRLTCCSVLTALTEWYHTCLLAIVPTLPMCKVIGAARRICQQSAAWCAAQDDDADQHALPPFFTPAAMHTCQPYIDHMLSPSLLCKRSDAQQVAAMHRVHALYLRFDPATDALPDLPAAESFGALPWNLVRPTDAPESDPTDTSLFWSYVDQIPLPVPHPASGGDEREAEAPPGVCGARRSSRTRLAPA
jgi:hypothetical protein